jgi:virulence factor Mce-like protein
MRPARAAASIFNSSVLVGTVTIVVVALAVYLSYIAENGLPFVPTYQVAVQVANADEIFKNADVRVGGARVGQVLKITPEPATKVWPHPYARLSLALNSDLGPLAPDTHYRIRLSSVLGGKYLELIPGHVRTGRIPDGGMLTLSTNPAANHELPFVDLDTALGAFGPGTRQTLRDALNQFGDLLAGRGSQLNDSLYATARLLDPLERLLGVIAAPQNRLAQLLTGAAQTTSALAAVAPGITAFLGDSATTFDALAGSRLGEAIDQTPPTEAVASQVLARSLPALKEAASVFAELRPAAALLPTASTRLDQIILAGTPIWGPVPKLADELESALAAVRALARDPASRRTFHALGSNDLATLGSSAFVGLGAILRAVAPAQLACNVTGLWLRNFASGLTEGDSTAPWLRAMPLFDSNQASQASGPAPDLHINYYPAEDAGQCQAGNEGYTGAQLIGNPPKTGRTVDNTAPPPGVLDEGRKAGLVP